MKTFYDNAFYRNISIPVNLRLIHQISNNFEFERNSQLNYKICIGLALSSLSNKINH